MLWYIVGMIAVVVGAIVAMVATAAWSTDLDNWGLPSEDDDHG